MTPKSDIVAGSRTNVSDLESGYHNVLAMKIINIYIVSKEPAKRGRCTFLSVL